MMIWSSLDIWWSSMDDLHGRVYRPWETWLIKSSIIVHEHYSFFWGDSWSDLLYWLWTMPLDELELGTNFLLLHQFLYLFTSLTLNYNDIYVYLFTSFSSNYNNKNIYLFTLLKRKLNNRSIYLFTFCNPNCNE